MANLFDTLTSQLALLDAAIADLLTEKVAESRYGERMYRKLDLDKLFEIRARINKAIAEVTPGFERHNGFLLARMAPEYPSHRICPEE